MGGLSSDLDGWMPIRIDWGNGSPTVDWCRTDDHGFVEPFFDQTVERWLRRPFNLAFRRSTPISVLSDLVHDPAPRATPAGFVFHMSRCGSTLVAQMLASDPSHVVISEAGPIDAILRSHLRDPAVTDDDRVAWLRGVVAAYGRSDGTRQRQFVKFDSWSVVDLPLIDMAFPTVPWVFLYREPVEVLASHARERGSHTLPGVLEPVLLGTTLDEIGRLSLDDYGALVIERICAAAVEHGAVGRGAFVAYDELPSAAWSVIAPWFGLTVLDADVARMSGVATVHAKRPYETFENDRSQKQEAASPTLRALADRRLRPWFDELEQLRLQRAAYPADGGPR